MGSIYRGDGNIDGAFLRHINGNAVYAVGDPDFHSFLEVVWRPALDRGLDETKTLAYDCALSVHFSDKRLRTDRQAWHDYQSAASRIQYTEFIQNISSGSDVSRGPKDLVELREASPRTFVIHGRQYFPAI